MMQAQLVVIGGGAAGFFCAVNAARACPQLKVTLLEKSGKLLSKVKVSGGGRCNVTHSCFDVTELSRRYPRGQHFVKKSFHWFQPSDTISWFADRGVTLKTEADGRMFPATNTSQTIIDCLMREAAQYGVDVLLHAEVTGITRLQAADGKAAFRVETAQSRVLEADYLCIAAGGYPKSSMFGWLAGLGHTIEAPVPSLFTFNMPGNSITSLMGVSVPEASVKVQGTKLAGQGPLLITHWGMSGPVILRLSAWGARELAARDYRFILIVNWLPDHNEQTLREEWTALRETHGAQKLWQKNPFGLPARLWEYLLHNCGIGEQLRWSDLPAKLQNLLIRQLVGQEFPVSGKTTFKEEFVTCGGISLREIDPNTMESRIVPGVFFAGEIMDVDGITGGFNFQHAWTSGWLAAKTITGRVLQA